MGIRFQCPNGHAIHVKDFLAGKKGVCPDCGLKVRIPTESTITKDGKPIAGAAVSPAAAVAQGTAAAAAGGGVAVLDQPAVPPTIAPSPNPQTTSQPTPLPVNVPATAGMPGSLPTGTAMPISHPVGSAITTSGAPSPSGFTGSAAPVTVVPVGAGPTPAAGGPHPQGVAAVAVPVTLPAAGSAPLAGTPVAVPVSAFAGQSAGAKPIAGVPMATVPGAAAFPLPTMPIGGAPMGGLPAAPAVIGGSRPAVMSSGPLPPGLVDPIAEAPLAAWYVRPAAGGQYGPARGDVLRQWIQEGRLAGDSMVWREGWSDWRSSQQVFPNLDGGGGFSLPGGGFSPPSIAQDPVKPAAATQTAAQYAARRKSGNAFGITLMILLGIVCIGLMVALAYILPGLK